MSAVETDARPQDAGPGARLQAAREAKGLTLEVLAAQLKVAPQRLRALEAESLGRVAGSDLCTGPGDRRLPGSGR